MSAMLELRNVGKSFGKHQVLSGFNLSMQPGEILGLLGPSGVGKSTVLRLISGLESPDTGCIHVESNRIGYVFQEARLLPWDTALGNVVLALRAQGVKKRQAQKRARHYLESMKLSDFEDAYPRQLSGGMRQRVALARAFAVEPEILLLDEPFTGLDVSLKETMRCLLDSALENSGTAAIHVTHDSSELPKRTTHILNLGRQGPLERTSKTTKSHLVHRLGHKTVFGPKPKEKDFKQSDDGPEGN